MASNKSWAHSAGLPSAVSALPSQHVESNSETSTSLPAWVKVVCTTELVQIGGKQNILEMGNYLNNHLKNQTVLRVAFFFFSFLKTPAELWCFFTKHKPHKHTTLKGRWIYLVHWDWLIFSHLVLFSLEQENAHFPFWFLPSPPTTAKCFTYMFQPWRELKEEKDLCVLLCAGMPPTLIPYHIR